MPRLTLLDGFCSYRNRVIDTQNPGSVCSLPAHPKVTGVATAWMGSNARYGSLHTARSDGKIRMQNPRHGSPLTPVTVVAQMPTKSPDTTRRRATNTHAPNVHPPSAKHHQNLAQAHRAETQRLRTKTSDGHWQGLAHTRRAALSPLGIDRVLRANEVTPRIVGPGFADEELTHAVALSLEVMLRSECPDSAEAIRFMDAQGHAGWFFYGWAQRPTRDTST